VAGRLDMSDWGGRLDMSDWGGRLDMRAGGGSRWPEVCGQCGVGATYCWAGRPKCWGADQRRGESERDAPRSDGAQCGAHLALCEDVLPGTQVAVLCWEQVGG